jgi:AGCS family alanine or glycine:cation symporter
MMEFVYLIRDCLWRFVFIPLFITVGIVSFFSVKKGGKASKKIETKGEVSPIKALFMNLGSTVGTGNIVGVSVAVSVGGAGSVFWMWTAALLGMSVSYAENMLGVKKRGENNYPVPYMNYAFSCVFSVCTILASFGMGNMAQSNSAACAAKNAFGFSKLAFGAAMSLICASIVMRGLGGILKFTDRFVPFMAGLYILSSLCVIYVCRASLPNVFESIFREALSIKAIVGGTAAEGIARGVFSGEAGLGSCVILNSRSNAKSPETQGFVGMLGIFIDTFVICTLTALAILSSESASAQGAFYKTLGIFGGKMLNVSLIFFAFTTIIGWSYYGGVCSKFLFGERGQKLYKLLFLIFIFVGAAAKMEAVWCVSDIFNALMALPNMAALFITLKEYRR